MKKSAGRFHPRQSMTLKPRKKKLSSGSMITVAVIAALVLFACTQVWQRVYILSLASEVGTLKKQGRELEDLAKKKRLEINELCRHSRIMDVAKEKFELVQTSSDNFFTLVAERKFDETPGFVDLMTSLKKVADHLPVVTESKAESKDIFDFDEN